MKVYRFVSAVLFCLVLCFPQVGFADFKLRSHIEENNLAVELLQQGQYLEGIELLKKSRETDPYNPQLKENLLFAYLAAGEGMIRQRRFAEAAELLLEAQEFDDLKREFWSLRGYAFFKQKKYDEAEVELQEALGMGEPDADIYYWLGQIYYATDRMYLALDALENAELFGQENHAVSQMLDKIRRELAVEANMSKEYGGHFVISFEDDTNEELGEQVLDVLEEAYNWIGSQLDFYPDERVPVLIYTRQQFRDLTDSPAWSGGLYDGKIRLPVGGISAVHDEVKRILYHEYMHVVLRDIVGRNFPLWLNEGLAQAAEAQIVAPPLHLLQPAREKQGLFSLARLEKSFRDLQGSQALLAYQQSYSVTRFLLDEFGWHLVRDLLFALRDGLPMEQAFEETLGVYGLPYAELEQRWLTTVGD